MRKFLPVFFVIIAVFVFGGCGGGSGSSGGGGTPPAQNIAFSALSGSWIISGGAGTATGTDGRYALATTGNTNESTLTLGNVAADDSSASFTADAYLRWKATRTDGITTEVVLDHSQPSSITVRRDSADTFSYGMPGTDTVITVQIDADGNGSGRETGKFRVVNNLGTFDYTYDVTYKLTRK